MPRERRNGMANEDDIFRHNWRWHNSQKKNHSNSEADAGEALDAIFSAGSAKKRIYRALSNEFEEIRPSLSSYRLAIHLCRLECRLEHANLGRSRPYEALSYVWGEPKFTRELILDGRSIHVTPNLETALRHLRLSHEERVLWIDAICVDQTNVDERRVQVGHMRKIYSHCSRDLCWLGPEDESVIRGIHILKKLDGFRLADIESLAWKRADSQYTPPKTWWTPNEKDWSALGKLLQRLPIWERVWIVQEVSCSPNVLLVCGSTKLDWTVIERTLEGGPHNTDAFHSPFSHDTSSLTKIFETVKVIQKSTTDISFAQGGGRIQPSRCAGPLSIHRLHRQEGQSFRASWPRV